MLKAKFLIGKDIYQSKNVNGECGILNGLFLAPKIKFSIVIDEKSIL